MVTWEQGPIRALASITLQRNLISTSTWGCPEHQFWHLLAAISWHWLRLACLGWPAGFESTCVWSSKLLLTELPCTLNELQIHGPFTHIIQNIVRFVETPDTCFIFSFVMIYTMHLVHIGLVLKFATRCPLLLYVPRILRSNKRWTQPLDYQHGCNRHAVFQLSIIYQHYTNHINKQVLMTNFKYC